MRPSQSTVKILSLLSLTALNCIFFFVLLNSNTPKFTTTSIVIVVEFLKLFTSLLIYIHSTSCSLETLFNDLFITSDWKTILAPSVLFLIHHFLFYFSVSVLNQTTFQIICQIAIPSSALFSVNLLEIQFSVRRMISISILFIGTILLIGPDRLFIGNNQAKFFIGFIAALSAAVISGLSNVWFEKILKRSKSSIWIRNIQLSLFSLVPALLVSEFRIDNNDRFFIGWDVATCYIVILQVMCGLLVSITIYHADCILMQYLNSASIVVAILSTFDISNTVSVGLMMVFVASGMYLLDEDLDFFLVKKTEYVKVNGFTEVYVQ